MTTVPRSSLWRDRDFLLLWLGQGTFEFGAQLFMVAVPLLAAARLGAGALAVSGLTALGWLPFLLVSLPAGVLVDRLDRRRLMISCDLIRVVLVGSIPVMAEWDRLTLGYLYAVVAACGVLTVVFTVAHRSLVPDVMAADRLLDANGKFSAARSAAELAGPATAGGLVQLAGGAFPLLGTALAFLGSAVTLSRLRVATPDGPPGVDVRAVRAVTEALGYLRRHRILRLILLATTVMNCFVMALTAIEVVFLIRVLRTSALQVGLLFTFGALGGLLTGALAGRLSARVGSARVIWLSLVVPGPAYVLMPLARPGWGLVLYAIGLAAYSAATCLYNTAAVAYRQAVSPPHLLGRTNATFLWVSHGVIPLGALGGGLLATWLGLRSAVLVCVLGTWAAAVPLVCSNLRAVRDVPAT